VYLPKDICEKIIKNLNKKNLTKILWLNLVKKR
jgi:Ni,Fe-hydrogenase I small subunit